MIGRLVLRARRLAGYNPGVVYHREYLRPRILGLPPLEGTDDASAEVHVLTSERDWLNTIWALRSFYAQVQRRYALVIHGDATLSRTAVETMLRHFPSARVIEEKDIREEVLDSLAGLPYCRKLRETNTLSIKSFDFVHTLQSARMILFDSDLLFFARPEAFLARLEADAPCLNVFNRDVASAYAAEPEVIRASGFDILPEVNSGFGLVYRESMKHEWMEEFLTEIPGLAEGHFWRIEQTLFALCATRFGAILLPDDYRVFLKGRLGNRPYRHYVGAIRDKMYTEGMRKLRAQLLHGAAE